MKRVDDAGMWLCRALGDEWELVPFRAVATRTPVAARAPEADSAPAFQVVEMRVEGRPILVLGVQWPAVAETVWRSAAAAARAQFQNAPLVAITNAMPGRVDVAVADSTEALEDAAFAVAVHAARDGWDESKRIHVEYGGGYLTVEPRFVKGQWYARLARRIGVNTDEDRRLERSLIGSAIGGAALLLAVAHGLVSVSLAVGIAFLGGFVFAAMAAPTLGRQIAYSIPCIIITLGELLAPSWYMTNTPYWHWGPLVLTAFVGALPGLALYACVRWLLGKLRR